MKSKIIFLIIILTVLFAFNAVATGYVAGTASHAILYADTIRARGNTATVTVNDAFVATAPAAASYGIYGSKGGNFGYFGGNGEGAYGKNANGNYGALGNANQGAAGINVNGNLGSLGATNDAVFGLVNVVNGYAVRGFNAVTNRGGYLGGQNYGVYGTSQNVGGNYGWIGSASEGVRGYHANGNNGYLGGLNYGVYGQGNVNGVYGDAVGGTYGVETPDKMRAALGIDVGAGSQCSDGGVLAACALNDVAEDIYSKDELENGDVVVIDSENNEHVKKSSKPYDTLAAGIISLNPAFYIRTSDTGVPLALAGRVKAKASAENGPIKRGDLLTTSSTPGHLMRCETKEKCLGAMVGKALEPLTSGKGKIMVLVTLG